MILAHEDTQLFLRLHALLMFYVNQQTGVVPEIKGIGHVRQAKPQQRMQMREAFGDRLALAESYANENPHDLSADELKIVAAWKHSVCGQFFLFRQLNKHMVFLPTGEPDVAYGVLGLTQSLEELSGNQLPCIQNTMLMPFRGKIVYDGLLVGNKISLGAGINETLNESYRQAKQRQGVLTTLPAE